MKNVKEVPESWSIESDEIAPYVFQVVARAEDGRKIEGTGPNEERLFKEVISSTEQSDGQVEVLRQARAEDQGKQARLLGRNVTVPIVDEMAVFDLLNTDEVPAWFTYPPACRSVVNQGLVDFHPWHLLRRERAMIRLNGLMERFPELNVVPFATRTDCDLVACFQRENPDGVAVLKDFAEPRIVMQQYPSFQDWVRSAVDDCLSFEPEGSVWPPPRS